MGVFVIIALVALLAGLSAVWAFLWAVRHGQFQDFQGAATSIFDDDEPIGEMTDSFPAGKAR